jgi:hypothetical protein
MQSIWKSQPTMKYQILKIIQSSKEYEYVFGGLSGFPPKRDIDFSIDLIFGATLVSKSPYKISTPNLKELQM